MCTSFTWYLFKFFLCKIVPKQQRNASPLTRILAKYQACHIIYQLRISSMNLCLSRTNYRTQFRIQFWIDQQGFELRIFNRSVQLSAGRMADFHFMIHRVLEYMQSCGILFGLKFSWWFWKSYTPFFRLKIYKAIIKH